MKKDRDEFDNRLRINTEGYEAANFANRLQKPLLDLVDAKLNKTENELTKVHAHRVGAAKISICGRRFGELVMVKQTGKMPN